MFGDNIAISLHIYFIIRGVIHSDIDRFLSLTFIFYHENYIFIIKIIAFNDFLILFNAGIDVRTNQIEKVLIGLIASDIEFGSMKQGYLSIMA